jgi:WD40 repeat protein
MCKRLTWGILAVALSVLSAAAQPPMPKAPVYPPINPAVARPDGSAGGLDGPGFGVAWSEDLGLLVVACENQAICYWHKDVALGVRTSQMSANVVKGGHHGPVTAVAAAGDAFASGGFDGKIVLWSLPAEKMLHTLTVGTPVRALAASPDGKALASTGDDAVVHLWDVAAGKESAKLAGAADWLLSVAFSPDGKTVLAGAIDGHWYLWDAATGKKTIEGLTVAAAVPNQPAPTATAATALAFSPDGKTFAAGGADGQVYLFNVADGKFVRVCTGHTSAVTSVAFHPTGTLLVSGSKDRTVRLWTPATGQLVKALEGHTAWVQGVTFVAQGTRLASAGADHTVRLWDLTDPMKK